MFSHRPALKFCIPFMCGIVVGWLWSFPAWLFLSIGGLLFILLSILFIVRERSIYLRSLIITLAIFLFGVVKIAIDRKPPGDSIIQQIAQGVEGEVNLQGVITDRAIKRTNRVYFIVDMETVLSKILVRPAHGCVMVSINGQNISNEFISQLEYGRRVLLRGKLEEIRDPRNPLEFNYRQYLSLNDIFARFFVQHEEDIEIGEQTGSLFFSIVVYQTRDWIGKMFDSQVGGEEAKLLKGLVIGERSEMAPEVKTAFINAGLMHILAVSGFNVGLVALILWTVFSLFRVPEKFTAGLTCLGLLWFMFLTGAQPPVVRAVIMAIVIIGAKILGRKPDLYNALAVSAIIMLLVDAKELFEVGFQLSFVAVFSLAYFYPKISSLRERLPARLSESIILKYISASVAVSFAATLGTLPLTAYYFNKISIVGIIFNLFAVPFSGIILALGLTVTLFSSVSTWIASVYSALASLTSKILLDVTTWGGNLPFAYVEAHVSIPTIFVLYVLLFLVFEFHRRSVRKLTVYAILIIGNSLLFISIFSNQNKPLRVTVLDVGQGDAIFIEFPEGNTLLVDAGPRTFTYDAGARTIDPYFRRNGRTNLDKILMSHPHSDHHGGIPFLLRRYFVEDFIDAGSESHSAISDEIHYLIDSLKILRKVLNAGTLIEGYENCRLYILHPIRQMMGDGGTSNLNLNNQSLVVKLVYGRTALLLTGDAEEEAEMQMVRIYDDFLSADVIKVGHHGSITSTSPVFLD
ncbi:MAG TPA: DNA internalization-related competence protein ComEC/Rec2, partial [Bacteroidota bacterium]|nr:DNA internalization-related competence protein ComEC/Rec2 [Bacteroidota bacterium]